MPDETAPRLPAGYDALAEAKRLLRSIRSGALATLAAEGAPFASLVACATMPDGAPILLLSGLAAHTGHLDRDGRCSILLAEGGKGDPLAHPRLTLVGRAMRAGEDGGAARRRFLARNPKSALYADFPDFAFWLVSIDSAHLNGGFARAAAFAGEDLLASTGECDDLLAGETSAVDHMNTDHRDAIEVYATAIAGVAPGQWRLSGLDPEGLDLVDGDRTCRVPFPQPVRTRMDLRKTLVLMAQEARTSKP